MVCRRGLSFHSMLSLCHCLCFVRGIIDSYRMIHALLFQAKENHLEDEDELKVAFSKQKAILALEDDVGNFPGAVWSRVLYCPGGITHRVQKVHHSSAFAPAFSTELPWCVCNLSTLTSPHLSDCWQAPFFWLLVSALAVLVWCWAFTAVAVTVFLFRSSLSPDDLQSLDCSCICLKLALQVGAGLLPWDNSVYAERWSWFGMKSAKSLRSCDELLGWCAWTRWLPDWLQSVDVQWRWEPEISSALQLISIGELRFFVSPVHMIRFRGFFGTSSLWSSNPSWGGKRFPISFFRVCQALWAPDFVWTSWEFCGYWA